MIGLTATTTSQYGGSLFQQGTHIKVGGFTPGKYQPTGISHPGTKERHHIWCLSERCDQRQECFGGEIIDTGHDHPGCADFLCCIEERFTAKGNESPAHLTPIIEQRGTGRERAGEIRSHPVEL